MRLGKLFSGISEESGRVEIVDICIDSRRAAPGSLFFALPGTQADGHDYIEGAVAAGAVAVVHSRDVLKETGIVYIKADDPRGELNRVADLFYGQPSRQMTIFGVTGTNGKSTTACLIRDLMEGIRDAGGSIHSCGYIGTVAVRYGGVSRKSNLTTPDVPELHADLAAMAEAGCDSCAMEVSSHGLAERRTDSVDFDIAAFTNLTWDHLDFHKTMEAYFEAKKRLFTRMKPTGRAVLNADDAASFGALKSCVACPFVSYGIDEPADYMASGIEMDAAGSSFTLTVRDADGSVCSRRVRTNLMGKYNISNLLCAIACVHQTGADLDGLIDICAHFPQVEGRMERIENGLGIDVIVDYAHTPDGFEKIFALARSVKRPDGRIICVFGSAGRRDRGKRPVLGRIAYENSDLVILTEEDPRDERPEDIALMIKGSLPDQGVEIIPDRRAAIRRAVGNAEEGDLVLILGKGDETYLDRSRGKEDWPGDNTVAREALRDKEADEAEGKER